MSVKLDIEGIFKNLLICLFFFYQDFLSLTLTTHRTAWEGRGTIFYSTLPLPLSSHQYLDIYFATLRVTWLSYISNRTACIYQAAPQWDLPPYRVTICMTDDVMLIVCLLVDLIQGFCYSYLTLETGGLELETTIILVLQPSVPVTPVWIWSCLLKNSLINKNLLISLMRKYNSH